MTQTVPSQLRQIVHEENYLFVIKGLFYNFLENLVTRVCEGCSSLHTWWETVTALVECHNGDIKSHQLEAIVLQANTISRELAAC